MGKSNFVDNRRVSRRIFHQICPQISVYFLSKQGKVKDENRVSKSYFFKDENGAS